MTDQITPGERRELRSVVRGQFKVLRSEVKRREQELISEVETELLQRYRQQDIDIQKAQEEAAEAQREHLRQLQRIGRELRMAHPDLTVEVKNGYGGLGLQAADPKRAQLRRAAVASIPTTVADAALRLDRQEMDLLRSLSEGALESSDARAFLTVIPTVGELVPTARLREIEASLSRELS
jgi:hypothetical protein